MEGFEVVDNSEAVEDSEDVVVCPEVVVRSEVVSGLEAAVDCSVIDRSPVVALTALTVLVSPSDGSRNKQNAHIILFHFFNLGQYLNALGTSATYPKKSHPSRSEHQSSPP